jgi:hypothetical protein
MAWGSGRPLAGLPRAFSGVRAGLSDGFGSVTGADTRIERVTSWKHRKASPPQQALRLTGGLLHGTPTLTLTGPG